MDFGHISVLLNETVESLNIRPDGIYVDGTLGGGGHAYHVAERLTGGGRLIGSRYYTGTDFLASAQGITVMAFPYSRATRILSEIISAETMGRIASWISTRSSG